MAYITAENVSLGYDGEIIAEGLNFTVGAGDYLCIVGENGSGKTTLMKTLLKLNEPLSGVIRTGDGLEAGMIGYLPQQTEVQRDFPASAEEIVRTGLLGRKGLFPFYTKEEKKRAEKAMEQMGLTDIRTRSYRQLSGGLQQRVLLARALCATEKLLLLDEPVSGLDPKVTAEMYALIRDLHKSGIAVIMITHDIAAAVREATHILHIGKSIFYGTCDAYRKSRTGRFFLEEGGAEE